MLIVVGVLTTWRVLELAVIEILLRKLHLVGLLITTLLALWKFEIIVIAAIDVTESVIIEGCRGTRLNFIEALLILKAALITLI